MGTNGKWESFSGKLVGSLQFRHSNGKKAFAVFRIDVPRRGIFLVKAFGEEAEKANSLLTDSGMLVSVHGKIDAEEGAVINADFLQVGSPAETPADIVSRLYGSRASLVKSVDDARKYKERAGMVRCKTQDGVKYANRDSCVQLADGRWMTKIEFLMEVFGGAELTKEMRRHFSFPMNEALAASYKKWVEEKMALASKVVGFD